MAASSRPQGSVLPGVTVVVRNQEPACSAKRRRDLTARFRHGPPRHTVAAELQGVKKFERKDLRLELADLQHRDLDVAVARSRRRITVTRESPLVDVTSKRSAAHTRVRPS